jgi:hypothetical protein
MVKCNVGINCPEKARKEVERFIGCSASFLFLGQNNMTKEGKKT